MLKKRRVILDTNLIISRALTPSSSVAGIVRFIVDNAVLLASEETILELETVLSRLQAKDYISQDEKLQLLYHYRKAVCMVEITERIQICRDTKDDKFLELAVSGSAEYLITGDKDLLEILTIRNTKIITAKSFMDLVKSAK